MPPIPKILIHAKFHLQLLLTQGITVNHRPITQPYLL